MSKQVADRIYCKYLDAYDGEIQGCCLLIADEIIKATGGLAIAGELQLYGGSVRKTHWWAEVDGVTLDPMGDNYISHPDDFGQRVEIHRDQKIFYDILTDYELWRVHS